MTQAKPVLAPSDAELVAYLDGELSPADSVRIGQQVAADAELAERIAVLMNGARPFRAAMQPLLAAAPTDQLDAMLSNLLDREVAERAARRRTLARWSTGLAAGFVLLLVGAGADRLLLRVPIASPGEIASSDESDDWRRAVAQYLSLTTRDTVSTIPDSDAIKQQELARVGSRVGFDLTPARVDLPDLTLKRAEAFDYDGKPLGHMAYLDPLNGPISLCIFARPQSDAPPRVERRQGMNVVYWSHNNRGFMLIGHASVERLQSLADIVVDRFDQNGADSGVRDRG